MLLISTEKVALKVRARKVLCSTITIIRYCWYKLSLDITQQVKLILHLLLNQSHGTKPNFLKKSLENRLKFSFGLQSAKISCSERAQFHERAVFFPLGKVEICQNKAKFYLDFVILHVFKEPFFALKPAATSRKLSTRCFFLSAKTK